MMKFARRCGASAVGAYYMLKEIIAACTASVSTAPAGKFNARTTGTVVEEIVLVALALVPQSTTNKI